MRRTIPAAQVDDQLDSRAVVIAENGEVCDTHAGAAPGLKKRVQRPAGGQPRTPIDEPNDPIASDGHTKVWKRGLHASGVASRAEL